jgi:hypothetical protein
MGSRVQLGKNCLGIKKGALGGVGYHVVEKKGGVC